MDTDKIQKLIRLANNNPNEHEANLAARKVCKMLADYRFNGVNSSKATPPPNTTTPYQDLYDLMQKMRKKSNPPHEGSWTNPSPKEEPKTWNDVKRSSEPFWRAGRNPFYDPVQDYAGGVDWGRMKNEAIHEWICPICSFKHYDSRKQPKTYKCATCRGRIKSGFCPKCNSVFYANMQNNEFGCYNTDCKYRMSRIEFESIG